MAGWPFTIPGNNNHVIKSYGYHRPCTKYKFFGGYGSTCYIINYRFTIYVNLFYTILAHIESHHESRTYFSIVYAKPTMEDLIKNNIKYNYNNIKTATILYDN